MPRQVERPGMDQCAAVADRQWFRADDEMITLVSRADVLSSEAYLLFYIKRQLEYAD